MAIRTSELRDTQKPINRAINGGMDYWQRGTSFPNAADFIYLADRFQNRKSAGVTSTINVDRVEDVASDSPSRYSMQISNTSVSGALGATDIYAIRHAIEGNMIQDLYAGSVTIQFKVKANHTATYGVSTHDSTLFGADSQYITFDINAADTWETKTIVFDLSSGSYDKGNGIGVDFWFTLAAGANLWQGDAIDSFVDSASKTIQISDVMVYNTVHGKPRFQRAGINKPSELLLCQRYFCKSYNPDVEPGNAATANQGMLGATTKYTSNNRHGTSVVFPSRMRGVPVVVLYAANGNINQVNRLGDSATAAVASVEAGAAGFGRIELSAAVSNPLRFHYAADAEL